MPAAGYVQELIERASGYGMEHQVFIIDGTRLDGSDYVTSVSTVGGIESARLLYEIETGVVSHWVRDKDCTTFGYAPNKSALDWRLAERFPL